MIYDLDVLKFVNHFVMNFINSAKQRNSMEILLVCFDRYFSQDIHVDY
jgi:hypothetical protein